MKGIGLKLVTIMLCIILFGIIITVGVSMTISGRVITKDSLSGVKKSTELEGNDMAAWLSRQEENINTIAATLSQLDDFSSDQQRRLFNAVLEQNKEAFDVYMGYPNGEATFGSGYIPNYSEWQANERGWYKLAMTDTNKTHITSPYIDVQTNDLCITASRAVYRDGELLGVVASDILITTLQEIVLGTTLDSRGYAILLDVNGDILVHPDSDFAPDEKGNFQNLATVKNNMYADLWNIISKEDKAVKERNSSGMEYYTSYTLKITGWHLVTVLPVEVVTKPIVTVIWIVVPLTLAIIILATLFIFLIVRKLIIQPVSELCKAAEGLAAGDIGICVNNHYKDEMGALATAFQRIADSVDTQVQYAKSIAEGDLTTNIVIRSEKDVMGNAFKNLLESLNDMFTGINNSSVQVSDGARSLADGAQAIAHGSTEQSLTVNDLLESIHNLSRKTVKSSEMANEASGLSGEVRSDAEKGNIQMGELLTAVRDINEASNSIEKVIKVIDDIAFQTNILALNASVEAARAGTHGKGFAVVAEEVRNLAGKSAEAAKDTGNLIRSSIEKATLGTQLAEDTSKSLHGIVDGINKSAAIVSEMAQLSEEQTLSISGITKNIEQVSQIINQNSATAQESAGASEEMSSQADILSDLVSNFKLN